jgi:hypothetical protein
LLGSSGASSSMVPMLGKSTYRHAAKSVTSSTDAAPTVDEGSDTIDITTSRSPAGGGCAESSSMSTITTSAPPGPAPAGGSNTSWGRSSSPRPSVPPRRCARLLHQSGHGQPLLDLHRERLGAQRLGTRLRGQDPRAQSQALQGSEAKHADVSIPKRRQN